MLLLIGSLVVFMAVGVPIAFSMGLSGLLYFLDLSAGADPGAAGARLRRHEFVDHAVAAAVHRHGPSHEPWRADGPADRFLHAVRRPAARRPRAGLGDDLDGLRRDFRLVGLGCRLDRPGHDPGHGAQELSGAHGGRRHRRLLDHGHDHSALDPDGDLCLRRVRIRRPAVPRRPDRRRHGRRLPDGHRSGPGPRNRLSARGGRSLAEGDPALHAGRCAGPADAADRRRLGGHRHRHGDRNRRPSAPPMPLSSACSSIVASNCATCRNCSATPSSVRPM